MVELNIGKEQYLALKDLSCNKNILQKADKGNSVDLINNAYHIKRMAELSLEVSLKEITDEPGKKITWLTFLRKLKVLLPLIYIITYIPWALNWALCASYLRSINL